MHIRTSSRLHFGLLGWRPQAGRQFGGVGLMIDSPGIELTVEPHSSWKIDAPFTPRVAQLVAELRAKTLEAGLTLSPAHIRVDKIAPEHVGLGVGTQLCLAVARALFRLTGMKEMPVEELARWTRRGRRSGIGLHGFVHGGLIVDGGSKNDADIPPLLARLAFPEDWSILILRPPGERGLHGPDENRAFANLPPFSQAVTDTLCRLVLLEILPAVLEHDLPAFGAALEELQSRVGAGFAPAQGGIYSTAQATEIVAACRNAGFAGVGQSSWGPTLYAFSALSHDDLKPRVESIRKRFAFDHSAVLLTRAANHGAQVANDR